MLTQTLLHLTLFFGALCLIGLCAAVVEQRKDPFYERVHTWFYASLPAAALHSFFYIWYAARIGS